MRQVVLQGQGALEIGKRLQMLKILRWTPEQEGARDVSFGKVRVNLERTPAMELCLLQPYTGGVEFEMAGRAGKGEGRVRQGKRGITCHGIAEMMAGLIHHGRIAGRRD